MPKARQRGKREQLQQSLLMKIASDAIKEAKSVTVFVPLRSLRHVPDFDAILRPISAQRVSDLSADIMCSGYRTDEQIFSTPPVYDLLLPRHILGGNHRATAGRTAGQVLVPSHSVSKQALDEMMSEAEKEEREEEEEKPGEEQEPSSSSEGREQSIQRYFKCIKLLMFATQAKAPNPASHTILQQVAMIRTFVQNDLHGRRKSRKNPRSVYGGYNVLRHGMFGDTPLHSDNSIHFLLNRQYTENPRHMNKCLAGAKKLIETKLRQIIPALRNRQTLLDLLLYWEHRDFVPSFVIAHLVHVGELRAEEALTIAESTTEKIYNKIRSEPDSIVKEEAPFSKRRVPAKATPTTPNTVSSAQEDEGNDRGATNVKHGSCAGAGANALENQVATSSDEIANESTASQEQPIHGSSLNIAAAASGGGAAAASTFPTTAPDTASPATPATNSAAEAGNKPEEVTPRRSGRKRTQVVLDNFAGSQGRQSKKIKTSNLVKKFNKTITNDHERIASLEDALESQREMNDRQQQVISARDKRIKEVTIRRQEELARAKAKVAALQEQQKQGKRDLEAKIRAEVAKANEAREEALQNEKASAAEELKKMKAALTKAEKQNAKRDALLDEDLRQDAMREVERQYQSRRDLDMEDLKKEIERLKSESEKNDKDADPNSEEVDKLRKEKKAKSEEVNALLTELEQLKQKHKELSSSPSSVKDELERLRKENEELRRQFTEGVLQKAEAPRGKRHVLPSDKVLNALSKKQLEAFLKRANRVFSEKKNS